MGRRITPVDDSIPGCDVCSWKVRVDKLQNPAIHWYIWLDHGFVIGYITEEIEYGMLCVAIRIQTDAGDCITLCVYLVDLIF
jgi:hypothetical protein